MKCLHLVTRSLNPTSSGRTRWMIRRKPTLNASAITFTKQLPDAPPGHYAAVQTQSAFSNLTVTEAVLLVEENEQWRVVGYNLSKTVEVAAKMRLF